MREGHPKSSRFCSDTCSSSSKGERLKRLAKLRLPTSWIFLFLQRYKYLKLKNMFRFRSVRRWRKYSLETDTAFKSYWNWNFKIFRNMLSWTLLGDWRIPFKSMFWIPLRMISDPATIVYFYIFYSPVVQFSFHHYSTGVRRQVKGANAIVIQDCGENTCMEFRILHKHGRKLKEDSMRIVKCNRTRKVFDPFLK